MNITSIKELSEEIKLQRFRTKKTQDDCAKMLGISIPTYKNLEDNPNKMDLDQALKLFDYIGFDLSDIFLRYILQNAIK
jgi:DNA-binding XRE family transcriptional regulator